MAQGGTFQFEIVSPTRQVISAKVSEVVLPAYDGERGVLGGHENFVGVLGTGPLKYVADSSDSWLCVSAGTYQMLGGKLTITAEFVEDAKDLDLDATKLQVANLEKELATDPGNTVKRLQLDRAKAQIEVNRRMRFELTDP